MQPTGDRIALQYRLPTCNVTIYYELLLMVGWFVSIRLLRDERSEMLLFYRSAKDKTLKFAGEVESDRDQQAARKYYEQSGYAVTFLRVDEAIDQGLEFQL